jgi:hypothetical protein
MVDSYMFRYPLGGMMSWVLQYLRGLTQLGHDVYFVEKFGYPDSCFDPVKGIMSDDCTYGVKAVSELLARYELDGKWCFVDRSGTYHGMSREKTESLFSSADLFIDMAHGDWLEEAQRAGCSVLIDGEPGFFQIKLANNLEMGIPVPAYDYYYTNGMNIGRPGNSAPDLGIEWKHVFHPVDTGLFTYRSSSPDAPYTTVMNWQSHRPVEYQGKTYGQKDIEFSKFLTLPTRVGARFEVAISGKNVPMERLEANGWSVLNAHYVTRSFDSFLDFIGYSRGEFSVCKNVFVANRTGWFSDRSAAFLAGRRPVVLQDTGYSQYLPTGRGLFAYSNLEEACAALETIESNYTLHAEAAAAIAREYLEATTVMRNFLNELGI